MIDNAIFLYGPSGSGKSTCGRLLAAALELPFHDLDAEIERQSDLSIPDIFKREGESGFRLREKKALTAAAGHVPVGVVALGGGALLDESSRSLAENAGRVVVLHASHQQLATRLRKDLTQRPLLVENLEERLQTLMRQREAHYRSFKLLLDTENLTPAQAVRQIQLQLGMFHLSKTTPCDIRVLEDGLDQSGEMLRERGFLGPIALVSDSNTGPLYGERVQESLQQAGFTVRHLSIPAGESYKNIQTVTDLWTQFLDAGLERVSTVVSLGGGVISDLAGFAAATYLRGIRWAAIPTTLLAMADASLGGKTGIDLPQGKNLAGSFHMPGLVLTDPQVLRTLPAEELRSGLAEVLKHGLIADPALWKACVQLPDPVGWASAWPDLTGILRRAILVKVEVVEVDPLEKGWRAMLNYGHTLGHAVEKVSNYRLRHGECVAIGMTLEARISESLGIAAPGLADEIADGLAHLGLPTRIPADLNPEEIENAIQVDKKKSSSQVLFALPVKIGEVKTGIPVDEQRRKDVLISGAARS